MDSAPPEPWSYAARAAYWGERVCRFCDHHNPAAAKFCNDCGWPLHLKPCNQCGEVNEHAATNCHKCAVEYPAFTGATSAWPAADSRATPQTTNVVDTAATVAPPRFAASALPPGKRLPRRGLSIVIATILIVGAYGAYWIIAATPDVTEVVLPLIETNEHEATVSAVLTTLGSKPEELETPATLQVTIPSTKPGPPKRASAQQRQRPTPAAKQASARQRPVPEVNASVGTKPPLAQIPTDAPLGARIAQTRKAEPRNRQTMHVSVAQCGGDLTARILCDQRVRRRFCEGHWGEAPDCTSVVNDRGQ